MYCVYLNMYIEVYSKIKSFLSIKAMCLSRIYNKFELCIYQILLLVTIC